MVRMHGRIYALCYYAISYAMRRAPPLLKVAKQQAPYAAAHHMTLAVGTRAANHMRSKLLCLKSMYQVFLYLTMSFTANTQQLR